MDITKVTSCLIHAASALVKSGKGRTELKNKTEAVSHILDALMLIVATDARVATTAISELAKYTQIKTPKKPKKVSKKTKALCEDGERRRFIKPRGNRK